jgi:hypothetical protein
MEHFMKKTFFALATVAALAFPSLADAQIGVAARGGTLGIGGEVALGVGEALVLRGGLGFMPLEPSATISDIDFTLKLPETWYNVGVDLYVTPSFRIGGGMLFKSDDPSLEGEFTGTVDIGGRDFTPGELGTLTGVLDSKDKAPYALIGFGKHTSQGVGLFLDLGVAFTGETDVQLDATGGTFSDQAELQSRLTAEEADLEEDLGSYLKYWPILNIGVRIGLGR